MVAGLIPLLVWELGAAPDDESELVSELESRDLGITAMAGEIEDVIFGGVDRVEGIIQGFFNGFPHKSRFPENNSKPRPTNAFGICPVKLLNERSIVAFSGTPGANSAGIRPEILLYERFKYLNPDPPRSAGKDPLNRLAERSSTSIEPNPDGTSPEK